MTERAAREAEKVLHQTKEWEPVTDLDAFVEMLMCEIFGPEEEA